jgi:hypothetical protein
VGPDRHSPNVFNRRTVMRYGIHSMSSARIVRSCGSSCWPGGVDVCGSSLPTSSYVHQSTRRLGDAIRRRYCRQRGNCSSIRRTVWRGLATTRHGVEQTESCTNAVTMGEARAYRRALASVVRCCLLRRAALGVAREAIALSLQPLPDLVRSPGKSQRTRFSHPGTPIRLSDPTGSPLSAAAIAGRGSTLASSSDPCAARVAV